MKKMVTLATILVASISLAACSVGGTDATGNSAATEEGAKAPASKDLGKFATLAEAQEAAAKACKVDGRKATYTATTTFTPEGKKPYTGLAIVPNPCAEPPTEAV